MRFKIIAAGLLAAWFVTNQAIAGQAAFSGLACPIRNPTEATKPPISRFSLEGHWVGQFGVAGQPSLHYFQQVKIDQDGDYVIAVKEKGGSNVPPGKITFCGIYVATTFAVQIQVAGPRYTTPQWQSARLTIIDADKFQINNGQVYKKIKNKNMEIQ